MVLKMVAWVYVGWFCLSWIASVFFDYDIIYELAIIAALLFLGDISNKVGKEEP